MVHIEHAQSNGMHMPLLDVDVADKNARFVAHDSWQMLVKGSSPSPPSFSMLHPESIDSEMSLQVFLVSDILYLPTTLIS